MHMRPAETDSDNFDFSAVALYFNLLILVNRRA